MILLQFSEMQSLHEHSESNWNIWDYQKPKKSQQSTDTRNRQISSCIELRQYVNNKHRHSPSSMHVIPRDHTSTLPSYWPSSIARITSGAIQYGVPTKELAGLTTDAEPKSATTKINVIKPLSQQVLGRSIQLDTITL